MFLLIIVFFLRSKLSALAALFEEASKCMLSLPGLAGPPVLAFIALAVFLTFWIAVVICLATANYPGLKPLIPFAQLQPVENNTAEPSGFLKNNTGVDYKCKFVRVQWRGPEWVTISRCYSIPTGRIPRGWLASTHVVVIFDWFDMGQRVYICLSAASYCWCCCILVFQVSSILQEIDFDIYVAL